MSNDTTVTSNGDLIYWLGAVQPGPVFAVRHGGVDLLQATASKDVWLRGEAKLTDSHGPVLLDARASSGNAFEFTSGGTTRLAMNRTGTPNLQRVSIEVNTGTLPDRPSYAGQIVVHEVDGVCHLCVGAQDPANAQALIWFKTAETTF